MLAGYLGGSLKIANFLLNFQIISAFYIMKCEAFAYDSTTEHPRPNFNGDIQLWGCFSIC
jgi:hypothetical protein